MNKIPDDENFEMMMHILRASLLMMKPYRHRDCDIIDEACAGIERVIEKGKGAFERPYQSSEMETFSVGQSQGDNRVFEDIIQPDLTSQASTSLQSPKSPQPTQLMSLKPPQENNDDTNAVVFRCKPSKEKHLKFMNSLTVHDNKATFSYSTPDATGTSASTWDFVADLVTKNWKKGIDTEINEMEEEVDKFKTTFAPSASPKKMDDKNKPDNWKIIEEKPSYMNIHVEPLFQRKFSGPRVINPHDAYFDDIDPSSSEDEENSKDDISEVPSGDKNEKQEEKFRIEKLPMFVDDLYVYSLEETTQIPMLNLTTFEHLDMINLPNAPFTVTIYYHLKEGQNILKAMQLFLSSHESYVCIIERACSFSNRGLFQNTKFGKLLTDPDIKRVCWNPGIIEKQMLDCLGFRMGPCLDLCRKLNQKMPEKNSVLNPSLAITTFLIDWPDIDQYKTSTEDYQKLCSPKKFAACVWDRDRIPKAALQYSALNGLAMYLLDELMTSIDMTDDGFIWQ